MDTTQLAAALAQMQQQMLQQQNAHAQEIQTMQQTMIANHAAAQGAHQQVSQVAAQAQQAAAAAAGAHAAPAPRAPSIRILPPKEYVGTIGGVDDWLSSLQQQFDYYHLSTDAERIHTAAVLMRGGALDWWQALRGNALPTTWGAFVTALRARFQPIDRKDTARAKLIALTQGRGVQSAPEYVTAFRRLVGVIDDMSESDQLFQFKRGLHPSIAMQLQINSATVTTLALAMDMAVRVGAATVGPSAAAGSHAPMDLDAVEGLEQSTDSAPVDRVASLESKFDQILAAMTEQRRGPSSAHGGGGRSQYGGGARPLPKFDHLTPAQVAEYMKNHKCFGCGSKDHRGDVCPNRIADNAAGRYCWKKN